jgi:hypothetical protein
LLFAAAIAVSAFLLCAFQPSDFPIFSSDPPIRSAAGGSTVLQDASAQLLAWIRGICYEGFNGSIV